MQFLSSFVSALGRDRSLRLVRPSRGRLRHYEAALARGWSPNTYEDTSAVTLRVLRRDRRAFLRKQTGQDTSVFTLPDGSTTRGVPTRMFWIWDGGFCGRIVLRTMAGTQDLPSWCLGHVGYSVVPWKQGRGYAKQALAQLLEIAADVGLDRVLISCNETNHASRRVIEANGGVFSHRLREQIYPTVTSLVFQVDTGGCRVLTSATPT